jgi:hypothetical protein
MIRNGQPIPWRARGLSDSLDGSTAFNGAMASLSNLIPDPATSRLWQCRPAGIARGFFSGAWSSGFSSGFGPGLGTISLLKIIGNFAYGLISNPADGFDHPFCFNLVTNAFVPVTGAVGGTLPAIQSPSGPWTPPIADLIGSRLMVTHIGFQTLLPSIAFGWFDISTPTAPVWHAGNLNSAAGVITATFFTAIPPTGVAQFGNRAYYIYNAPGAPALVFSDILNPLNMTSSTTQVLTLGDSTPLSALGQLRFYNQLGGIIQGLVVFKGAQNTYQVTGDAATNNLALNSMNLATGTLAPLSVVNTPRGLGFMSPDGFRIIDFQSNISDPIGIDGQGVVVPFLFTAQPSRICAACSGNIIRITTQNSLVQGAPYQEYWYDLGRQIWHGPHTLPASVIQAYQGTFILASPMVQGTLFQSDPVQNNNSVFVENGVPLMWIYQTIFLPDTDQMGNIQVSQTLLDLQIAPNAPPVVLTVTDQNALVVDSVSLSAAGQVSYWGQFNWGQAVWGSTAAALAPRILPWHFPLVFAKAQFTANGQSAGGFRVGAWHFRYKQLRYLANISAAA